MKRRATASLLVAMLGFGIAAWFVRAESPTGAPPPPDGRPGGEVDPAPDPGASAEESTELGDQDGEAPDASVASVLCFDAESGEPIPTYFVSFSESEDVRPQSSEEWKGDAPPPLVPIGSLVRVYARGYDPIQTRATEGAELRMDLHPCSARATVDLRHLGDTMGDIRVTQFNYLNGHAIGESWRLDPFDGVATFLLPRGVGAVTELIFGSRSERLVVPFARVVEPGQVVKPTVIDKRRFVVSVDEGLQVVEPVMSVADMSWWPFEDEEVRVAISSVAAGQLEWLSHDDRHVYVGDALPIRYHVVGRLADGMGYALVGEGVGNARFTTGKVRILNDTEGSSGESLVLPGRLDLSAFLVIAEREGVASVLGRRLGADALPWTVGWPEGPVTDFHPDRGMRYGTLRDGVLDLGTHEGGSLILKCPIPAEAELRLSSDWDCKATTLRNDGIWFKRVHPVPDGAVFTGLPLGRYVLRAVLRREESGRTLELKFERSFRITPREKTATVRIGD